MIAAQASPDPAGVGWHEHHEDVFVGCDAFYRPAYVAELVPSWIPALDGVDAKLTAGARVADIGCGLGSSTACSRRTSGKRSRASFGSPTGRYAKS